MSRAGALLQICAVPADVIDGATVQSFGHETQNGSSCAPPRALFAVHAHLSRHLRCGIATTHLSRFCTCLCGLPNIFAGGDRCCCDIAMLGVDAGPLPCIGAPRWRDPAVRSGAKAEINVHARLSRHSTGRGYLGTRLSRSCVAPGRRFAAHCSLHRCQSDPGGFGAAGWRLRVLERGVGLMARRRVLQRLRPRMGPGALL